MSHKHNKRRRAQVKLRRQDPKVAALAQALLEASLPVYGLSKDDLSAAPDHCRTLIDVYMWKMDLPRDVAEARMAEITQGISDEDVDRVLAPLEGRQ